MDRVGRRVPLIWGLGGMGGSLCLLALGFMLGHGQALGLLTCASLTVYVGFFAVGLGPVFWLLISEIFPLAIRARGMSAATIANWLANLVVALTFLDLAGFLGHAGVLALYAVLTFAGLGFAYALLPETKGLTLEAVQALWTKRAASKLLRRRRSGDGRGHDGRRRRPSVQAEYFPTLARHCHPGSIDPRK